MIGRAIVVAALVAAAPAAAQGTAPPSPPPGPYVVDLRGVTMALPDHPSFFPAVPAGTLIPGRGFGGEAGAHVYLPPIGGTRLGLGASLLRVFGTTSAPEPVVTPGGPAPIQTIPDIRAIVTVLAPQLSVNFGGRNGWSYLSAGYGVATSRVTASGVAQPGVQDTGWLRTVNAGGGARWFRSAHLAIGFDIRLYVMSGSNPPAPQPATPRTTRMAASVGISLR